MLNFSSGGLNDDTAGTLYSAYTVFPAVSEEGLAIVYVKNRTGGSEQFSLFLTRDGVEESLGILDPAYNASAFLTSKLLKVKPGDTFRAQRVFNPSGGMFADLGFQLYPFE